MGILLWGAALAAMAWAFAGLDTSLAVLIGMGVVEANLLWNRWWVRLAMAQRRASVFHLGYPLKLLAYGAALYWAFSLGVSPVGVALGCGSLLLASLSVGIWGWWSTQRSSN